jgi:HEAT repeat protein
MAAANRLPLLGDTPLLKVLVKHPNPLIRMQVASGINSSFSVYTRDSVLNDPDPRVRKAALQALGLYGVHP